MRNRTRNWCLYSSSIIVAFAVGYYCSKPRSNESTSGALAIDHPESSNTTLELKDTFPPDQAPDSGSISDSPADGLYPMEPSPSVASDLDAFDALPSPRPFELFPPSDATPIPKPKAATANSIAAVRAIIEEELSDATSEERDIWFEQLKSYDPVSALELLRIRKITEHDSPLFELKPSLQFESPLPDQSTSEKKKTVASHADPSDSTNPGSLNNEHLPPEIAAELRALADSVRARLLQDCQRSLTNLSNVQTVGYKRIALAVDTEALPNIVFNTIRGLRPDGAKTRIRSEPTVANVIDAKSVESRSPVLVDTQTGSQATEHSANARKPTTSKQPSGLTNHQVAERIAKALGQTQIAGFDMAVRYQNGVATLSGTVATAALKALAEKTVLAFPGVLSVNNQISTLVKSVSHEEVETSNLPIRAQPKSPVGRIRIDPKPGVLKSTDNPFDLAIDGAGWFQLLDPEFGHLYTRCGIFSLDSENRLVFLSRNVSRPVIPEIRIPANAINVEIDKQGKIRVQIPSSDERELVGEIKIVRFVNPSDLVPIGGSLYSAGHATGRAVLVSGGTNGTGSIRQGFLEESNVHLSKENERLTELIRQLNHIGQNSDHR